jgi:hypothetical protein
MKILREKLKNDQKDPEQMEKVARARAEQNYNAYLRQRTATLLDNAKRAEQYKTKIEEDEPGTAQPQNQTLK